MSKWVWKFIWVASGLPLFVYLYLVPGWIQVGVGFALAMGWWFLQAQLVGWALLSLVWVSFNAVERETAVQ